MFCRKLTIFFLSLALLCSFAVAQAEEKTDAQPEEKKEEGKVEEGKSALQSEWFELQARLQTLKAKNNSKNATIKKLIADKQSTKDEKAAVLVVNQLKVEYSDLQKTIREYEEQRNLLNYRFPEKGLTEERKYERIEVRTLDELENEFSLEGKVKKALARLRQQYPLENSNTQRTVASEEVPAPAAKKEKDPSRSSVTESQIISK